ncbi:beta-ketoacyl synthase [Frankia sp. R43]|uniref:type I polyketide synthase n=1 Tax=Frankia sp. R43 TaxID=269536 RepID=UPI0006DA168E|nr:type I polyketide synthase [Frankia sp. R43]KPM56774.1 beta-ketoacyl synthase [Frankia sp. R43]
MSSAASAHARPAQARRGDRDLVVVISPFGEPAPHLIAAVGHCGALGVLDLGLDAGRGREALAATAAWSSAPFGVRVAQGCPLVVGDLAGDLAAVVDTVLLGVDAPWSVAEAARGGRRVLVEVLSVQDALRALADGADGLVARGNEAGGRVGDLTTFTLLQHLNAANATRRDGTVAPVWAAGGIGPATAAAAVAGGAAGVVLDSQLALVREVELPAEVAKAVRAMDGSETALIDGHRVYIRPDLPVAALVGWAGSSQDGSSADEPALDFRDTGGERASDGALTAGRSAAAGSVASRLGGRDLRTQLLPIGQDGAFAAELADRHVSASAVVGAVRASIRSSLAAAARHRPLASGSAFAAARGLRHPVAQGPMTRVSDRAQFAHSVASAGGLPFLALALMSGPEARALLTETADLLGDLPWGVGILGFAPPEVRAAQLDAVHAVRPPCALIAGGRPAQSAPLEAAGIDTFLHVPSPGLLERFLADGARKFVFEGRECGGHVGPRASFPLWEAQISGLLAFARRAQDGPESLGDVHILFAGGIHDATSAAMVAAAAAPLVERGAQIGVLMGTAYLFTEEAVEDGAIMPGFQEAAIAASRTVLLETSPGHATRCVESGYVREFLRRRDELTAAGVPRKQMWAELEQLNLGRLRIASRGVRREGGELVAVGASEQAAEGMFMIGQVSALRSARTTIGRLHAEVTDEAMARLSARAGELAVPVVPTPAQPADAETGGTGANVAGAAAAEAGAAAEAADAADAGGQAARAARSVASVRESARPIDIAIVGMSAVFPSAADEKDYWANVVDGVDAITEVPAERWDVDLYYDPDSVVKDAGRRTPSKWGGFLPRIPFDALAYGIPPRSLRSIDPGQLLALEVASRALRDAGYDDRPFDRRRASVVFGAESGSDLSTAYGFRSAHRAWVGELPAELEEILPELDEDSFPGLLANVIAGRVANRLDLGGLNFTVDAACASSLAALDAACKELTAGSSDLVLCGGVDTHSAVHDFLLFASVHALSPGGRCRSFAAGADGTSLGEGVAVVVLKRLADAQRDGDRIRAVIRSVAGSSDGRALGLTAPRKAGQVLALERAYSWAGISPSEVGVLEAHATGTVVGDRTELATLTEVFTEHGAETGQCAVGSVKSQIGHTKCAAGLAGLVKVARAVETGVRPPTLHVDEPNPYWDRDSSPFYFDDEARPWVAPPARRHAGLSAFGFGGTNFHVVVSAYDKAPEPAHGLDRWSAELFLVRARDRAGALRRLDTLAAQVRANEDAGRPFRLRDFARTVCEEAGGAVQIAFVVDDLDDLPAAIERARDPRSAPRSGLFVRDGDDHATVLGGGAAGGGGGAGGAGSLAFLFPGQGSQRPGMLADLFVAFPRLRSLLELAPDVAATMFPPAAFSDAERAAQSAALTDTRSAQPALGLADLAIYDLLGGLRIRPDHVAGHSYGELAALCAAGVFDRRDLVRLSRARAEAILAAAGDDPGTMAAVSATAEQIRAVLGAPAADGTVAGVALANQNAPRQTVISGPTAAIDAAVELLKNAGLSSRRIPVACAFHSPVVAAAADGLATELAGTEVGAGVIPVWSNMTAGPYPQAPAEIRAALAGQLAAPVRFVEQIEAMYAAGVRVFVEVGPGRVLSQLAGKILAGRPHRVVATDAAGEPGLRRLLLAVAELAVAGADVDPSPLFVGRDTRVVAPGAMPRRPGWLIDGAYVRTSDGGHLPGGLLPARRISATAQAPDGEATPAGPAVLNGAAVPNGAAALNGAAVVTGAGGDVPAPRHDPEQLGARPGDTVGGSPMSDLRTFDGQLPGHPSGSAGANGAGPASAGRHPGPDPAAYPALPAGTAVPAGPAPAASPAPLPAAGPADTIMLEFLRTGRDLVAAQRDVLLTYLGAARQAPTPATAAVPMSVPMAAPALEPVPVPVPVPVPNGVTQLSSGPNGHHNGALTTYPAAPVVPAAPEMPAAPEVAVPAVPPLVAVPAEATVAAAAVPASVDVPVVVPGLSLEVVTESVVGVIAELTGYPVEMLEPDLDLEADLSIDSIKRTEILGELAGRVGLPGVGAGGAGSGLSEVDESVVEELAAVKTVRGIASWIVERGAAGGSEGGGAGSGPTLSGSAGSAGSAPTGSGPAGTGPGNTGRAGAGRAGAVPVSAGRTGGSAEFGGSLGLPEQGGGDRPGGGIARPAPVSVGAGAGRASTAAPASALAPVSRSGRAGVAVLDGAPVTSASVPVPSPAELAGRTAQASLAPESWGVLSAPRGATDPTFAARVTAPAVPVTPAAPATLTAPTARAAGEALPVTRIPLRRFVIDHVTLPAVPSWDALVAAGRASSLAGTRFVVVEGDLGIGLALSSLLEQAGAQVRIVSADNAEAVAQLEAEPGADGLFWVASAGSPASVGSGLPEAFGALRAAALAGPRRLFVVTGLGGDLGRGGDDAELAPGVGLAGLVRTLAHELPDTEVRLVDVHPKAAPRRIAERLLAEMFDPAAPVVVGYRENIRITPELRAVELAPDGRGAAGPAGLDASGVVLLTGGARGITARTALALARATGCAVELVGRTPIPDGPEDPATVAALDAPALRRALIETGVRRPAEIEKRIGRILAEREIRATLAALGEAASSVRYHAVDVRDGAAVAAVVADVYARHGRLDGVVHGAGVLEDRLLRSKTPESFDRVFRTKVDGAGALLDALRPDVGFVVLFGSVAGVFGNRGQVDYAAANDALDVLAHRASARLTGRVVSVDWGPWGVEAGAAAGRGMVSEELAREYARRGIGLIDPDEGVAALLRELREPVPGAPVQVVQMCGDAASFTSRPSSAGSSSAGSSSHA